MYSLVLAICVARPANLPPTLCDEPVREATHARLLQKSAADQELDLVAADPVDCNISGLSRLALLRLRFLGGLEGQYVGTKKLPIASLAAVTSISHL